MIEAFKKLWPNRTAVDKISSMEELEKYVRIELNDELTHPRVRKTKAEKLQLAMERIEQSDLADDEKTDLAELYKKIAAH
ncbi:hypothetical protein [Planomicrobium sp. CPCC 101079]|uniref:hypothetical protein n=1 Tax=Planomicrobium sp. CPCC 101079 TaxID=2599618 RepID=UPI0011B4FAC4|nr:hypothetical protein [Planomicrobium sp. CPCC 101079]TWT00977.1 hypothetical protein FQV28_16435 [Planomicrobium sp. CPCC 101079]